MLKCFVIVLCAITIVFCAPGYENLREKQSARQEHVTDELSVASRTKRQSLGTVEVVYVDAASLNPIKLKDLPSKESFPLAPVNDVTNPRENFQQLPGNNLEVVTQNSNYIVYKLKNTGDLPLNGLPDDKRAQDFENQYYGYDSDQLYTEYSGMKNRPPPPPPGDRRPPPPPPPHHHHPPPPPPPHDRDPSPHHYPPPPDDYDRLNNYDRYDYYNRRSPPPHSRPPYDDRYDDDRRTRQSSYGRPPPRYDDRPPPHHGGPPHRFDDRPPPHRRGPPHRFDDRPPPHHGGPPHHHGGPPHHHGGPPHHHGGPPPPPPPNDDRPRPDQDQNYDQGNGKNEHYQDDHSTDVTPTSSTTTEAADDDDQYQLDVRFNNDDEEKPAETMKRAVTVLPTARPLSSFMFQAAAVTPVD